ncbi:AVN_collapsed_G0032420.mRNA.1.CDS.1 [Saccharomyces cerevisiae]|nr:AVN_collapsed_G0032420.mRNA.1.CDS.1 [Saccharomyces cerevisiae]
MTDEKVNSDQNMNGKQGVNLISCLPTTQVPVSILTNKERRKSIHDESNFERSDSHEDQSKSNSNRRNIYKNDYSTNLRDFSFANLKQNSERNKDGHEIQINTSMPANTNGQQKRFSPSLPSANTTNDGTDIRKHSVSSGTSNSEDEVDSPSMEKNSIVHMPGDFIYFNPKSNASKPITAKAAPLSANNSTHKNKEVITAPTGPRVPLHRVLSEGRRQEIPHSHWCDGLSCHNKSTSNY